MAYRQNTSSPMYVESRSAAGPDEISLAQIFSLLWRRRWFVLSVVAGVTLAALGVLKTLTPTYTSTAIVILSGQQNNFVDLEQSSGRTVANDASVRSEVDALQSRTLINRVIDRENLFEDPEFNPYKRPYRPNLLTRTGIADLLPWPLGDAVRSKPLDPGALTPEQVKYSVATQVMKAYQVTTDPKTYSVDISFTSIRSEKASRIANAFVEEYMRAQIDERLSTADSAATWLSPRLQELRKKVEETGRAVAAFREANHIVDLAGSAAQQNTLAIQEIQNLAQGMAQARATRAELEAAQMEVERLAGKPEQVLSAPAVAAAPIVENLRVQESTQEAQLASLLGTYGENHPLVISARKSLNALRTRLKDETGRAVAQLGVQMRQAQASENELQARMTQLTKVRSSENRANPRLQQLESEQTAAKSVYDSFVQGLARAFAQDGVPTPKGRVVQRAEMVDWPTYPNISLSLSMVFCASIMLAIAMVYCLEARDNSFCDTDEVEDALELPVLGVTIKSVTLGFLRREGRMPVSRRILADPGSLGSEVVRQVRTAINYSRPKRPKVVMVTSAIPGEGKTAFVLMVARQAAQAGKRVLAIEAEMRKPTFARELTFLPRKGLAEYLTGEASFDEVVGTDEASGVHFIAVRDRSNLSGELLASERMASLIRSARENYDLVVIDTPPAGLVADPLQFGDSIDAAVLVVKWGETPKDLVLDTVRKLRAADVPLVGTVLTQVDLRRHKGAGYGVLASSYASSYYAA